MRFTIAHFVAVLASVGSVTTSAVPKVAGYDNARKLSFFFLSSPSKIAGSVSVVDNSDDFVGTPEEIYTKVKARYDSVVPLEKRNQEFPPLCIPVAGWNWQKADVNAAGQCRSQMGNAGRVWINAQSCSRVCCVTGNQVWICNDNNYAINPALPYIQSYVGAIVGYCTTSDTVAGPLAGGQMFDTDGYNVILRGEGGLATDCDFSP
ncbi:hypothetical protein V8E51_014849 [Hyaloscypha variabilis]